ncbi:MAG TPA: hypothetical protein VHC43_14335 [Mycobacteriales bacterium]|nr:hypothetical protein [Mycobacteriales bacterium]
MGTSRARRRRFVPAAAATVAALLAGALALAFSVNKGGAALSNTQMLALVHTASTGLSRSPATTFTMTMTLSGDGQQQTIHMSGFGSNGNREASFTATGPGISESSVFLDGVAYVQVPAQAISTNGGKPWIGVRSPNLTGEQQQLESGGPTGLLQSLADFGGTVKDDGSDSVHGVQTTKYTVELNLQSMIERESAVSGSSTSPLVNNPDLNQDFPMSIWIDKQGLPRELTMSFDIDGISMQAVAYFTPTSVVPTISAPPASEVNMLGSLSDFRSSLQQFGASS